MKVVLESAGGGAWSVKRYDEAGELISEVPRAVAVRDLCHILHKSQRQVYRYIRDGRLETAGKYLGEWLVNDSGLNRFAGMKPGRPAHIPASARPLFPEYRLSKLNPVDDASVVVPRILEQGDRREIAWLLHQYPVGYLRKWMAGEGWRLGPRPARFWSWYLGVSRPAPRQVPVR